MLGRQKDWMQLLVTTLLLFCDYLKEISIAEGQRLEAECLYLLLPGSCPAPQTNLPLAEREIIPTRDCGDLLEAVIAALVKPAWSSALLYVPSRGNFDVEDPDRPGRSYMAYLRQHMDRYRKPDYIAMQIRVDSFCEAAPRLTGIRCDWRAVVSALRKAPPPYLREVKPAFMPADEVERAQRKTYTALTMDINRMAFLTDSERAYLRGRLLGKTDEQAWADVTAETVQPVQPDEAAPSKEPSSEEPCSEYDPEVWERLREKDDAVENRILDQWDFLDFDF